MSTTGSFIPFVKANGCGNDFLIVEERFAPSDRVPLVRRMCDRHTGLGADGVEWVSGGDAGADITARLFNADGSDAEISGNGTRCVAAYSVAEHGGDVVRVRTGAGVKACNLISRQGNHFEFSTAMGVPEVRGERRVRTATGEFTGWQVSMGNPHLVVLTADLTFDWRTAGAEIQREFPGGVNVEFVRVRGENELECVIYERGVGETRSSGSGSCAAAVAVIVAGQANSPVRVNAPGGTQTVQWNGQGSEVVLQGPAEIVCRGEFFL